MRQGWCRCQCRYGCWSNIRRVVWICRVICDISGGWMSVVWCLRVCFESYERCFMRLHYYIGQSDVPAKYLCLVEAWVWSPTVCLYGFELPWTSMNSSWRRDTHSCLRGGRNSLAVGRVTVPVLGQRERLWCCLVWRRVNQLIVLGYECCRDLNHCRQARMRHSTSVFLVLTV